MLGGGGRRRVQGMGWGSLNFEVFKVANLKHTLVTSSRKWLPQPPLEQLLHSAFRKLKDTRIASIQKGTLINAFNQYILNPLRSVNIACLKRGPADTRVRACEVHQANTVTRLRLSQTTALPAAR